MTRLAQGAEEERTPLLLWAPCPHKVIASVTLQQGIIWVQIWVKLGTQSGFLLNDGIVAGREREKGVESFPKQVWKFGSWPPRSGCHPHQLWPVPPLRKQLLSGTKRPVSVSRPSCAAAKCQAVYVPWGPSPGVLTGPACGGRSPPPRPHSHGNSSWATGRILTAQEAGFMEAAAFALNLFRKVNRLLAHPTFLASSPVRHPETGPRHGN